MKFSTDYSSELVENLVKGQEFLELNSFGLILEGHCGSRVLVQVKILRDQVTVSHNLPLNAPR